MPLGVEGGDVVLHDGSVAATALGSEHVVVVVFAVGLAILLVEALVAEGVAALAAEEVLRVPRLVQRRHAFLSAEASPDRHKVREMIQKEENIRMRTEGRKDEMYESRKKIRKCGGGKKCRKQVRKEKTCEYGEQKKKGKE